MKKYILTSLLLNICSPAFGSEDKSLTKETAIHRGLLFCPVAVTGSALGTYKMFQKSKNWSASGNRIKASAGLIGTACLGAYSLFTCHTTYEYIQLKKNPNIINSASLRIDKVLDALLNPKPLTKEEIQNEVILTGGIFSGINGAGTYYFLNKGLDKIHLIKSPLCVMAATCLAGMAAISGVIATETYDYKKNPFHTNLMSNIIDKACEDQQKKNK